MSFANGLIKLQNELTACKKDKIVKIQEAMDKCTKIVGTWQEHTTDLKEKLQAAENALLQRHAAAAAAAAEATQSTPEEGPEEGSISLVDLETNYPKIYKRMPDTDKNKWFLAYLDTQKRIRGLLKTPTNPLRTGGKPKPKPKRRRKPSVKALKTKRKQLKEKIKKAEKCVKTCTKNKLKLKKQCK